uniref:Uncharacterized protein n=1 Tax=Anguilla anguilla TaxID=7936 RepID=A0A0E9RUS5_ANGAN
MIHADMHNAVTFTLCQRAQKSETTARVFPKIKEQGK